MTYREAPPPRRACPRCGLPLGDRVVAGDRVEECTSCGGVFVGVAALNRWLGDAAAQAAVREAFPSGQTQLHPGGAMYVKCPVCAVVMNRRQFAAGAAVVVDVCRAHGTWFDAAELGKVMEFVLAGGLDRAAAKEAERRADEERAARVKAALAGAAFEQAENRSRYEGRIVRFLRGLFGR